MNDVLKLIVIPIIASALTILISTFITIFKEIWQEKRRTTKDLRNEKLIKLYNKLYVIKIKFYDRLDVSDIFAFEDEPIPNGNFAVWDKALEEVHSVLDENIHLLEAEDLLLWEKIIRGDAAEHYNEEAYKPKYVAIRNFLQQTSDTYKKLYKNYHNLK